MPRWGIFRWLVLPLGAVGIATGLDLAPSPFPSSPLSAADWTSAGYGPANFEAAMVLIDDQLALGQQRAGFAEGDWLRQETLARAYMARSRFSVGYDDLAEADRILTASRANAPANSGPLMSMAVLGMMSHRLSATESALDIVDTWAVPPGKEELVEVAGLRGDLAFYRGDMRGAQSWYTKATDIDGGPAVAYRLANLAKARGDFDQAIQQYLGSAVGSRRGTPFQQAITAMQIGAIEQARGNHAEAAEWFARADKQFPGFWLFEAHRAQALSVAGDLPSAIESMRTIAEKHPAAEVMDALAMLLRANGQAAESRQWAERAGKEWQRRLALAPEGAYGHALEHELVFGTPARALELAHRNFAARPFGQSRIMLASALVMNGRYGPALLELERAEASGWRSAPLYALKAQIYELTSRTTESEEAREAALKLNARIFSPATALVWFGHG